MVKARFMIDIEYLSREKTSSEFLISVNNENLITTINWNIYITYHFVTNNET